MLDEDAKTCSLLKPEHISLIVFAIGSTHVASVDTALQTALKVSQLCVYQHERDCRADESKDNVHTKLGGFSTISQVGPLRPKTEKGANRRKSIPYQSFLHLKVVQSKVNFTINPWYNWCRDGATCVHACLSCQITLKGLYAFLFEQFVSQGRVTPESLTWPNFDQSVVLNEDGVASQVTMDDWGITGVEVATDTEQSTG